MFEISWSEILVIGVVALIVVGPKELPTLLRTVGKYMGIIKRQAAEFRAQFDEAMRESELDQIRKDMESIKSDAESTLRDASRSVQTHMDDARREFDSAADSMKLDKPAEPAPGSAPHDGAHDAATTDVNGHDAGVHDASGLPLPHSSADAMSGTSAGSAAIAAANAAAAPREPIKTGA